ncbi:hypothetical protein D3C83_115860 [compost metagenome]
MRPGFAFAAAISSLILLTPSEECATNTSGDSATSVIGAKSLMESYGSLPRRKPGLMPCVALARNNV